MNQNFQLNKQEQENFNNYINNPVNIQNAIQQFVKNKYI